MLKIGLIQPNYPKGGKTYKSFWLPYSIASVYTYVKSLDKFKNKLQKPQIIFRRESITKLSKQLAQNQINLFSSYVWNWKYNLRLAEAIKLNNPNSLIVFGGPQVSENHLKQQREKYPFVDSWVISEGELSFEYLLDDYFTKEVKYSYGPNRVADLTKLPSVYASGIFDDIIKSHPDFDFNTTLETNRGCPFNCTFCDWGSLTYAKVKKFPLNRVYKDIDWICKNKIGYVFIADANFGIFPERDFEIARYANLMKQQFGAPETWNANWYKNSKENVLPIVAEFAKGTKHRAFTLSVQSMDETVLQTIERQNMPNTRMENMLDSLHSNGLSAYTELILPLPNETKKSYKEGIIKILELGQHDSIEIWLHQLFENSESNKIHRSLYDFETRTITGAMAGYGEIDDVETEIVLEEIEIVVATNTMSYQDFLDCFSYSDMIINFHTMGWTQLLSRVMVHQNICDYKEFYQTLYDKLNRSSNPVAQSWRENTKSFDHILNHPINNEMLFHNLLWRLSRIMHENPEIVWKLLSETFDVDPILLEAQKHFIHDMHRIYPYNIVLKRNYLDLLSHRDTEIINGNFHYQINNRLPYRNKEQHLEDLFFKRRGGYGKNYTAKIYEDSILERVAG